jgi:hypothetical protein
VSVPAVFDAALHVQAADLLVEAGHADEAVVYAGYAVEGVPGNERVRIWESDLVAGNHDPHLTIAELIYGVARDRMKQTIRTRQLMRLLQARLRMVMRSR